MSATEEAVILSAARTPIGKFMGALMPSSATDLGAAAFRAARGQAARLVLLTTSATLPYHRFTFARDDTIVLGRESAGVPPEVHAASAARLIIPMAPGLRSINVALAAAMVLGEALRQTALFPGVEE